MNVDPDTVLPPATRRADPGLFDDVPVVREVGVDEPAREGSLREAVGREAVPGELARVEGREPLIVQTPTLLSVVNDQLRDNERVIRFEVLGTPAPKGSTHARMINGRAVNLPAGSSVNRRNLRHWDTAIREAAIAIVGEVTAPPFVKTALVFHVEFRLARPAGHWGKRGLKPSAPKFPIGKPDGDKLARQAADSLATIVFDDDSRIVRWEIDKVYAQPGGEGATFEIREAR